MIPALVAALFGATPAEAPKPFTEAHKAAIREAVGKQLADPFTAQYEWPASKNPNLYCGWVNARNRFGAYVGYQLFVVTYSTNRDGSVRVSKTNTDPEIAAAVCRDEGYSLSR